MDTIVARGFVNELIAQHGGSLEMKSLDAYPS